MLKEGGEWDEDEVKVAQRKCWKMKMVEEERRKEGGRSTTKEGEAAE
jgi:hypothetical protein